MPPLASADLSLTDVFAKLQRHWPRAVGAALLVLVAAVAYLACAPRIYRSEGKLLVKLGRENVALDPTTTLGQGQIVSVPQQREDEINSVVEVLKSQTLAEKVVDAVGPEVLLDRRESDLVAAPQPAPEAGDAGSGGIGGLIAQLGRGPALTARDRAVMAFQKSLRAQAAKKTNIVNVTYDASTPELAQTVIRKLIEFYRIEHARLHRTPGAMKFLAEQAEQAREKLLASELALRQLKDETGVASPDGQQELLVQRIAQLEDELNRTEASFLSAVVEARLLRESLTSVDRLQVTNQTTNQPAMFSAADGVRQQLYGLQLREIELLSKYTENHVDVQQVRNQIKVAQAALNKDVLVAQVRAGAPDGAMTVDEGLLIESEPQLAALNVKARTLRTQLKSAQEGLRRFNDNSLRISRLVREIELEDANYRKYSASVEQARIEHSLEIEKISNISLVQDATYSPKPVSPKRLFVAAGGLMAALLAAVGVVLGAEAFGRGGSRT